MGLFSKAKQAPAPVEDVDATVARLIELAQAGGPERPAAPAHEDVAEPAAGRDRFLLFEDVRWDADGRLVLPRAAEDALADGYRVCGVARTLVTLEKRPDAPVQALASVTVPPGRVPAELEERASDGWTLLALVDGGAPSLVFERTL